MGIQSFLQAEKGDPDWRFSPDEYFGKQFKLSDANTIELKEDRADRVTLRLTPNEKGLLAKNLRMDVRDGAKLDVLILNDSGPGTQQVFIYDIRIREGAVLNLGIFVKGGKFNKHILQIEIEEGGTLASYGYMSNSDQGDTEIITKVYQRGQSSLCTQLIGAQAGSNSQTVYQGMVQVHKDAVESEAGLESLNLITGTEGRCYSKPEITYDTALCKTRYASQTSTIDGTMMQYLASKGLDEVQATDILVTSFQNSIFRLIPQEELRQEVDQMFKASE